MPEFYATKFGIDPRRWPVRLVVRLEQASIRFASAALTCNEPMRRLFVDRSAPPGKVHVVLNSADESIFAPASAPMSAPAARPPDGRFVLISPGTMEERYGLDTVIRATAAAEARVPGVRLELYGDGTCRPELEALVRDLGVEHLVTISAGFVPLDELLAALHRADAGVVAIRRDAFRDVTHCNKLFEFVVLGLPAIVSRTRSVEEYFGDDCFLPFEGGDVEQLTDAIVRLAGDAELRGRLVDRARTVNEPYRWVHQRAAYLAVVDGLLGRTG
jgi:glycosyltransferase involved in cell wall biosynthesis